MTTKLEYQIKSEIDYNSLDFNPDEPEITPDGMLQYQIFQEIFSVLDAHLTSLYPSEDVFRNSATFICYNPNNLNVRVGPDYYFAVGVDAPAITRRKIYLPWEAGKPPDFVLEVGSESTALRDVGAKPGIYAQIGVPEYWRFDPTGGELYGQPLAGDRLVNGVYQPIDLTTEPDGILKGYSPALRLSLCWSDAVLKFYNHETGAYLRNLKEERAARQDTETALQNAADRIRQLEAELRRRQRDN